MAITKHELLQELTRLTEEINEWPAKPGEHYLSGLRAAVRCLYYRITGDIYDLNPSGEMAKPLPNCRGFDTVRECRDGAESGLSRV